MAAKIEFHYPDVAREKTRREVFPYASDETPGTAALLRPDFQEVMRWVMLKKGIVLVSEPEIMGAREDFRAAKAWIRRSGGLLYTLSDMDEEYVRGLLEAEGEVLNPLIERVAKGRRVRIHPVSESPHEDLSDSCAAPREDVIDLYLRHKSSPEEWARELIRVELYEEGYPSLRGSSEGEHWTDVLWLLEISRRMAELGLKAERLHDQDIDAHKGHSIHSYSDNDLLMGYLFRLIHPTDKPEERDAFLARVGRYNVPIAEMGTELAEMMRERQPLKSAEEAGEFFGELSFWLANKGLGFFHVFNPNAASLKD